MARGHDVVFVCGVSSEADRESLDQMSRAIGVTGVGITAPNSGGTLHRVAFKLETLLQGVVSGVSHRFYQAAHTPLRRGLAAAAMSGEFDVMQIDYWYLGLDWIARCEIPSVCYVHDLTYQRLARQSEHLRNTSRSGAARALVERFAFQRGLRQSELDTLSGFDALAAISPEEAQELRHTLPGHRVEILPAGVVVSDSVLAPYTPPARGPFRRLRRRPWERSKRRWSSLVRKTNMAPRETAIWRRALLCGGPPSRPSYPRTRRSGRCVGRWRSERCDALVSAMFRGRVSPPLGSGMKGKVLEAMAFGSAPRCHPDIDGGDSSRVRRTLSGGRDAG